MKHKTAELEGALLDAAVAMAQGWHRHEFSSLDWDWREPPTADDEIGCMMADSDWSPSTSWADGGPIMERKRIAIAWFGVPGSKNPASSNQWGALVGADGAGYFASVDFLHFGPLPLIAAMRACVASELGAEVELP